jgi:hypothetical protein
LFLLSTKQTPGSARSLVLSKANRISGLMECFPGYREFVSDFALE